MPEPLTDADLAAIRERCDKATPGPWNFDRTAPLKFGIFPEAVFVEMEITDSREDSVAWLSDFPDSEADAAFIAHAREDIPRLLAEVDRLREERDAAVEDVQRLRAHVAVQTLAPFGDMVGVLVDLQADVERLRAALAAVRARLTPERRPFPGEFTLIPPDEPHVTCKFCGVQPAAKPHGDWCPVQTIDDALGGHRDQS